MNYLHNLVVAGLSLLAMLLATAGMDWINLDHGLHPAVAFPLATLAAVGGLRLPFPIHKG